MSSLWRALRRRIMTPSMSQTRLDVRGFHTKDPESRELLEAIGRSFLTGFGYAAGARTPADAEWQLETVDRPFRGFAYEGAAMGFTILDGLRLGGGGSIQQFLAGRAEPHVYMVHIGVGWGLARLPRWRWAKVMPTDPFMRWFVFDGYGFHQAYFHTRRYVHERHREEPFRGPGGVIEPYANRAIDQGIGRALWFVAGADVDRLISILDSYPRERRSDLYSGAGLAASYAGGADETELSSLRDRAREHRASVAQGSVFACEARVRAGLVTPHTRLAARVFCGMSPEDAAAVADEAIVGLPPDGEVPAFEVFRQRIAAEFGGGRH
ncbi:MAG TPA: DUF1702 family protein [Mycobacteriales bacterium]|jgi:hypothetical protein|nr:DUF1702 family protein [Mycobacteriales bacterium]